MLHASCRREDQGTNIGQEQEIWRIAESETSVTKYALTFIEYGIFVFKEL